MNFKIPFTVASLDRLKKRSAPLTKFIKPKRKTNLEAQLINAGIILSREQYLSICLRSAVVTFIIISLLGTSGVFFLNLELTLTNVTMPVGVGILAALFIFMSQRIYPRVYANRKQREIERNLLPALEDMLVQLHSGIPLFTILVNISAANYGSLSDEFKTMVKKINAGLPQIEVLEVVGENNQSLYFRRTLWQISNGMRAGSDLGIVIKDTITALNEEQMIQIQNYGNKLNPVIMFYMLVSVIVPALAITFLTVISSLISIEKNVITLLFTVLFIVVVFMQIMFLGVIKSMRPSLI